MYRYNLLLGGIEGVNFVIDKIFHTKLVGKGIYQNKGCLSKSDETSKYNVSLIKYLQSCVDNIRKKFLKYQWSKMSLIIKLTNLHYMNSDKRLKTHSK